MEPCKRKGKSDDSRLVTPMGEIAGFPVRPGMFEVNGALALPYGVNFTIHTQKGTGCELLLFRLGEEEPYAVLPFPEEYKIGNVYSMIVFGLDIAEFEYAYRMDGPYQPDKGYIFDKNRILLDPYARAVTGQTCWGKKEKNSYHARVVKDSFDWGDMPQSKMKMSDLIIYELHVRGFTNHPSSGVNHRGTFAGLREKIPYLKELGINAVELMPIFEFDENMEREIKNRSHLLNYWGYSTVGFFAPKASYSSKDEGYQEGTELKELIKELHENGIEVILDVVFNHTAEGNEDGNTFSFKGLDNKVYYMLKPDGSYYNFSGCGNTLNCNHPIVQQMIIECLRYWTVNYRVDGFRFDLASVLGRNEDGSPMNNPPLLKALAYDPILGNVKLIAEAWDAGGMYQVGKFPAHGRFAEWNGRYRDSLRSFLKGDYWESLGAAWSIAGSGDMYRAEGYAGYDSSVNFITCHDGFTLHDLYSYNEKHNEANGWDNTDGSGDNRSWNCGVEGETTDKDVLELRSRMIRNAAAVLLCSRGTPMFLAGDEFGNSQNGNNNAYCQDNETSWINWEDLEKNQKQFEFFKFMINYRKRHPAIRKKLPKARCGMLPLGAYNVDAVKVIPDEQKVFAIGFAGYDEENGKDDLIYMAVNAYWEDMTISLPQFGKKVKWYLTVNTSGDEKGQYYYSEKKEVRIEDTFVMRPRSVAIFTGRTRKESRRKA